MNLNDQIPHFLVFIRTQMRLLALLGGLFFLFGFGYVSKEPKLYPSGNSQPQEILQIGDTQEDSLQQKSLRLSELIQQANGDLEILKELEKKLSDSTLFSELNRERGSIVTTVIQVRNEINSKDNTVLTNRQVRSQISILKAQKDEVESLINRYEDQVDQVDDELRIVSSIADYWTQYNENSNLTPENSLFAQEINSIRDLSGRLAVLYGSLTEEKVAELNQLFNIQKTLEEDINSKSKILDGLETVLDRTRYRYWDNLKNFSFKEFSNDMSLYYRMVKTDLEASFSSVNLKSHLMVLLLLSFIYLLSLRTKKQLKFQVPEFSSISADKIKALFDAPLLTSVFLTYLFSSLIYLDHPPIINDISGLIIIGVILAIVRKFFHISMIKLTNIFITFWLLLKIGEIISFESIIGRTLLIGINIGLIYFIIRLTKSFGSIVLYDNKAHNNEKFAKYFVWAVVILLIFSLLLNFSGLLNASVYLSSIVIKFSLFALYLFLWNPIFKVFVTLRFDGKFLKTKSSIQENKALILKYINIAINILTVAVLIYFGLKMLNLYDSFSTIIWESLNNPIALGSISFALWDLILFSLILWFSVLIARIIRTLLRDEILVKASLEKGLPDTISLLVRYAIITLGFFVAITSLGIETSQLAIVFGAFSVGIGFGLQNIFNNLVSGLILIFERPINIEDTIEVSNLTGHVKSIGIRSSNIKTLDGAEVIVPNGQLISQEVINWTLSDKNKRIEVVVGVAYGSDIHKVKELLGGILRANKDVLKTPAPAVFFQEFGDSSLNFRLLFWTKNYSDWLRVNSDILFEINDVFVKENIEIPFPQRDIHVKSWKEKEQ